MWRAVIRDSTCTRTPLGIGCRNHFHVTCTPRRALLILTLLDLLWLTQAAAAGCVRPSHLPVASRAECLRVLTPLSPCLRGPPPLLFPQVDSMLSDLGMADEMKPGSPAPVPQDVDTMIYALESEVGTS